MTEKKQIDPFVKTSTRSGVGGIVEGLLRKTGVLGHLLVMLIIAFSYIIALTISFSPMAYIVTSIYELTTHLHPALHFLALGFSIGVGYLAYGFTLIFVVPAINFLLPLKLKPFRGPYHSLETIPWYTHNALTQLVRYTFLNLVTPSPVTNMFYRMMGMKIGKNVLINTTNISDPCMITLEDYVTIGGSATMFAHYGQKNYLVVAPLLVKRGAVIGLRASLFGDVVVGEKAVVGAHKVVLPKTVIAPGEKY